MRTVDREQIEARLRVDNPWWKGQGPLAAVAELRPRAYLKPFMKLVEAKGLRRAVILLGQRRVGKTVMIHHAIQELIDSGHRPERIFYISVDHPLYNGLSLDELLERCLEATGTEREAKNLFVFFDEVQYSRDWETHLKILVDRHPNIRCVASGSAAAALKLKSNESGAGRFTDFLLPPLTFHEYLDLQSRVELIGAKRVLDKTWFYAAAQRVEDVNAEFINYLNFGGYPEALSSPLIQADPGRFIKSDIIDKVLLRDLPSLYGIQDIQELNYLFTTLAYNTAGEVSIGQLASRSGVAKNTLKRYIEYLEAAFLIKVVHRIDRNAKRFLRANNFKVYLTNPSMRSALFSPVGANDESLGYLAETAIFAQWFHSERSQLHYARWPEGEVDIVHVGERQKPEWAVEVKWSDRFVQDPRKLTALVDFCKQNSLRSAVVTTLTQEGSVDMGGVRIEFIPTSLYCYTVGRNVVETKHGAHSAPEA